MLKSTKYPQNWGCKRVYFAGPFPQKGARAPGPPGYGPVIKDSNAYFLIPEQI